MTDFRREERYVVLKVSDIVKHLSDTDKTYLADICCAIESARESEGKRRMECVVVESDWPEYEPTWAAIESRMSAAGTAADARANAKG